MNRQPLPARGTVNNAALERLASVTDRVQARPVPSALEKAPAKKKRIAGRPPLQ
ncbi:hypothetical protein AB2E34_09415 [Escherichia coli]